MVIKGLDKFSLVDYPGKLCAVVFVAACNFRCPYCHNPHLVLEHSAQPRIAETAILSFLESRIGKIDAVVVSGGEPALQKNLPLFLEKVKNMGYLTKLETNGSRPEVLKELIDNKLLDAVGIDYKAPKNKYTDISKCNDEDIHSKVIESIRLSLERGKLLELKTTVHKKLLSVQDLYQMRKELDETGAENWILQQFHRADLIDGSLLEEETYSDAELAKIAKEIPHTRARGIVGIYFE